MSCKNFRVISIEYAWLIYAKPFLTYFLSGIFGILSIIILYAELANMIGIQNNLIHNIITTPDYDIYSPNYFYLSNVNKDSIIDI